MIIMGNAIYYVSEEKLTIVESGLRTIKYCIISIALLFIGALISSVFSKFNIDLSPFIGIN